MNKMKIWSLFFLCLIIFLIPSLTHQQSSLLTPSFYNQSCPNVVHIVSSTISNMATHDNVVAPSILRLINHDCFVEGCDASIMISSTPNNVAEKDAPDNSNLPPNAFNAIISAKQAVEAVCPGVVSCADILALAARDSVVFLGGPNWDVPLGRSDGLISQASRVKTQIPGSTAAMSDLVNLFTTLGLTLQDLVALSGAHTVGFSHCNEFTSRLYNFNSTQQADPSMDPSYVQQLRRRCSPDGSGQVQPFDPSSSFGFDNSYYAGLQARRGLLSTDQILFDDPSTRDLVNSFAASQSLFFSNFVTSMLKMTSIGVKTGNQGEIRRDCTAFNSHDS